MANEALRRNLDRAFDPGPDFPDRLLMSRTMALIEPASRTRSKETQRGRAGPRSGNRFLNGVLTGTPARVTAGALVGLVVFGAVGVLFAIHQQHVAPASIQWTGCGGGFQCGSLKVPLDYSNPTGEKIGIALIRKPATLAPNGFQLIPSPSERIGSLVISTGIGSGVAYIRQTAPSLKSLNARFDLVGFDPRGNGQSAPVRCLTNLQRDSLNAIDTVLDDPSKKQAFINAEQAFVQACSQQSGRILPFVDTASSARDLDAIRASLGEAKLTYFGVGYGTFLGQMYAHLFPTHVRALALDGVVDPTLTTTDIWLQWAGGFEANLQAFLDYCRGFVGCQLGQSGDPGVRLSAMMQRLEQNPLPVGNRVLTRSLAMAAIAIDLYDPRYWNSLDLALSNALNGDGQLLLTLADLSNGRHADGSYAGAGGEPFATLCLDRPAPSGLSGYDQLGPTFASTSPFFGPAFQYGSLACTYWPVRPKRIAEQLTAKGVPPVLLIGATGDPVSPYAWAQSVNRQLAGSVLLTRNGYGFTSYGQSLCVRDATTAYLTDLTLPAPGTICASDFIP